MRFQRLVFAALAVCAVTACKDNSSGNPVSTKNPPLAYVRYVNAVADTFALDFRPIDQVEYSQPFLNTPFRGLGEGNYQGYQAGSRHVRVFPDQGISNYGDINVVTQIIADTTISFTAGTYYTVVHTGFTRAGASPKSSLWVITDPTATPGSGISYRIINTGADLGNVGVYVTPDGVAPLPASPTFANVAFKTATNYANTSTGPLTIRITAAGSTTVLATATLQTGTAGTTSADPIWGSGQAGSVVTAFIFGKTATGKPGTAFTNPGVVYFPDQLPPRTTP